MNSTLMRRAVTATGVKLRELEQETGLTSSMLSLLQTGERRFHNRYKEPIRVALKTRVTAKIAELKDVEGRLG